MFTKLRRYLENVEDRRFENFLDSARAQDFTASNGDMRLDYSKTNIDSKGRTLLINLLDQVGLAEKRDAMFRGSVINETEGRAVLHTALRNLDGEPVLVEGVDVMPVVLATLDRMNSFAKDVRSGAFKGQGGEITDVINIGIGGSDLGPAMGVLALAPYHDGPRCHFVSNVDPSDIAGVLRSCDPATTLVIVASKTFTTIETMTNARTARAWMGESVRDPAAQFVALSTSAAGTAAFGISPNRVFGFEDWVGGRYSIWGPIGLSMMIAIGSDAFYDFLRGGQDMDQHFCAADWSQNLPALLALTGIWHNQICGYATRAILPYDNNLSRLPAYLQQLEMESNGKSVSTDGEDLLVHSGPVVWGESGTNGQHAFYQLIHQGTRIVPCEFLVAARGHNNDLHYQHQLLVANCLAQSEALMKGRNLDEAREKVADRFEGEELERQASHRVFPGNRPSVTIAYPKLNPFILGQILALYEHRVFVEGVVLGINSYDQWGVELGKELATVLQPIIEGGDASGKDSSTAALVDFLQKCGV
ncbi:MAG: glucose-6-phosphate isomerase [Alteromonas macleodii]|jgi:glucose-6-phosphate isomerase